MTSGGSTFAPRSFCLASGCRLGEVAMDRSVTVRGTLRNQQTIELHQPVVGMEGDVEVVLRAPRATGSALPSQAEARDWVQAFRSWVESHDPTTPALPAEALTREEIYRDRG
jgi:hypothetical protein